MEGCAFPVKKKEDAFDQQEDRLLKEILERSIETAGGLTKWRAGDTLSFQKKTVLYFEDGTIESTVVQQQQFIYHPYFQAVLTWEKDSQVHTLHYDGERSFAFIGEKLINGSDGVHHSVLSAAYVIGMPFELMKDVDVLSFEGRALIEGDTLFVVKADYPKRGKGSDIWWYFFDPLGNYRYVKVHHAPTYAWIQNEVMDTSTGLTLPGCRKSYRIDSLMVKKFLRGEFWYTNYSIH